MYVVSDLYQSYVCLIAPNISRISMNLKKISNLFENVGYFLLYLSITFSNFLLVLKVNEIKTSFLRLTVLKSLIVDNLLISENRAAV